MTRGDSVQMPLTREPRGWPAGQLLSRFGPKLLRHVSTREEKGYRGGESQWRLTSLAGQPRGLASRPPLGELPSQPIWWSSPMAL
jgi:hypothetical protein